MSTTESRVGKDAELTPSSTVQMFSTIILKVKEWVHRSPTWQQILNRRDSIEFQGTYESALIGWSTEEKRERVLNTKWSLYTNLLC